jgi:hypothetical protein
MRGKVWWEGETGVWHMLRPVAVGVQGLLRGGDDVGVTKLIEMRGSSDAISPLPLCCVLCVCFYKGHH